jgi:hypothetical protein
MVDGENFWDLNDFWRYYKKVDQPVLIYATENDPAVPFEINSQRILNKKMQIESSNIRVVELPKGVHCTLPAAYDWHALASLFQSYRLSHSPGFKMTERTFEVDLTEEGWGDFLDQDTRVRFQALEPDKKETFVKVDLSFENSKGKIKSFSLSLPLSQFDFRFLNPELSSSEQEMIVRWLHQNLHFKILNRSGKYLLKTFWTVAS